MAGWRQAPRAENPQLGPKAEQERCVVLGLRAFVAKHLTWMSPHPDVTPPPCQCAPLACEWPSLLRTMTVAWPLWTAWSWRCVHVCGWMPWRCMFQLRGAVSSRQRRATSLPCSGSMVGTIPVCCSSTVRCDGIFSVRVGGTCSVGSRHEGCFPLPQALSLMMASCLPRAM